MTTCAFQENALPWNWSSKGVIIIIIIIIIIIMHKMGHKDQHNIYSKPTVANSKLNFEKNEICTDVFD